MFTKLLRAISLRRALLAGAGLGGLAFLAFAAHYCHRGWEQCHPPRFRVTPEEVEKAKRLLPELRELEVQTADGTKLRSSYLPPQNGVVMVLVAGLGGNRASLLDEAVLFARHGYGCLLLEARANGDSGGDVATWGYLEADDVMRAVKLVYAQPGVVEVGALGFSVGGSAVALAAARDPSIHAVILYATWTSIREEIAYKARHQGALAAFFITKGYQLSGVDLDVIQPRLVLKQIAPRPIYLLSGDADDDTPARVMTEIQAACPAGTELWHLPSVGHGGYLQSAPAEYERRVVGFLDSAFPKRRHS